MGARRISEMMFREKIQEILEAVTGFSGKEVIYMREMGQGNSLFKFHVKGKEKIIRISEVALEKATAQEVISWLRQEFKTLAEKDTLHWQG